MSLAFLCLYAEPVEQQYRGLGKWVSFGPSSSPKYGCKETYKYELNNDDESEEHTISYHRLGECPSWYGPGRMCTLDMLARRVPSLKEVRGHDVLALYITRICRTMHCGYPALIFLLVLFAILVCRF